MSRSNYWTNDDGLKVGFGTRTPEDKIAGLTRTAGAVEQVVLDFDYDDLPVVGGSDTQVLSIPAGSQIVSSKLNVKTAAAGGTSYNIGLYQADGTVIDADGIDAGVLTAALTAGAWIENDGALVGASIGSAAGQIVVAATGTFTAGSYRLVIEYIKPKA